MLHGDNGPHDHPPEYDPNSNFTIHADLSIYVESAMVTIPAGVGQGIETNDTTGRIEFSPGPQNDFVTLGDFFDSWQQAPQAGSPSTIVLSDTQLFDNVVDQQNSLQMFVNGFKLEDDFADYQVHDEDDIVLVYGSNPVITIVTNLEEILPTTVNNQPVRGRLPVELRADAAPGTVNNFLNYSNDGDYDNAFFHRYVQDFVIQGGGFSTPSDTFTSVAQFGSIPTDPPIQNEFQISNTPLTIAMAKLGGNPDSATNQWFINLGDNSSNLDNQNGGFTVFGNVLEPSILNTVTGLTTTNEGGAYTDLPLGEASQLVVIETIEGTGTVSGVVYDDLNENGLQDQGEQGLENITVYSDANGNDQLDAGELSAITATDGSYSFEVPGGQQHTIRQVPTAPYTPTSPGGTGEYSIVVDIASEVVGRDFGNSQLTEPTAIDLLPESDSGSNNSDNLTNFNNSSLARAPSFSVAGVSAGETVRLRVDGVIVSEQSAAAGGVVQLDGVNVINDGEHTVTATRVTNGIESAGVSLTMTVDSAAPVFSSQPPATATVDEIYTYDAETDEEGNSGFSYSLNDAQTGTPVSPALGIVIDSLSGAVTWTPSVSQLGDHAFVITATDAAGNTEVQPLDINVSRVDVVRLRLEVVDAAGNSTTSVNVGDSFQLRAFVQDLRDTPDGVFSAYADITFDPDLVTATDITHGESYGQGGVPNKLITPPQTINDVLTSPGLLDEVGSFAASIAPLGPTERLLFTVDLDAIASGSFSFMSDPADVTAVHEVGLYNQDGAIPNDQIEFGSTTLMVLANFVTLNPEIGPDEDSAGTTLQIAELAEFNPGFSGDLTITSVEQPSNGQVTVAADGKSLTYVPVPDFFGLDPFEYTVTDGTDSGKGTVEVAVQPVNDPPVAVDDTYQDSLNGAAFVIVEDTPNNFLPVLNNDLHDPDDPNTEELFVNGFPATSAQGGTLGLTSNGRGISYTPPADFRGEDTFTYTARDDRGGVSGEATVTLNVIEFNDPPTAVNDTATVAEDSAETIIDVLANDTTAPDEGEVLTVTEVSAATNGGAVRITNNMIGYTPASDFAGEDTFTYTISDGNGGTAVGTVTVTVTNVNDPPSANDDSGPSFRVTQNTTGNTLDVLANDSALPDTGETLTVTSVDNVPTGSTITIAPDGSSVLFTPPTDFLGSQTFSYTISDGNGLTDSATVTVNVVEFVPGSLAGFVYIDADNDGVKEPGERGLEGVTITLTGTDTFGEVNRTEVTDVNGFYNFENLAPGNYILRETQPDENIDNDGVPVVDGIDAIGSQGGVLSSNDEFTLTLEEGVDGTSNNFGEVKGRRLTGGVFYNEGLPHRFGNIEVNLFRESNAGGPAFLSGTTGADGQFEFDGLSPDAYSIVSEQPEFLLQSVDTLSATIDDVDSIENNFTTASRLASTLSYRDFAAFRANSAAHAAVRPGSAQEWYALDSGWEDVTDVNVSLTASGTAVMLEVTDTAGSTDVAELPTSHPKVHVLSSQPDGLSLIRLDGDLASFEAILQPADTTSAGGEGESPQALSLDAPAELSALNPPAEGEAPPLEAVESDGDALLGTPLLLADNSTTGGITSVGTIEVAELIHQQAVDAVHANEGSTQPEELAEPLISDAIAEDDDLLQAVDDAVAQLIAE